MAPNMIYDHGSSYGNMSATLIPIGGILVVEFGIATPNDLNQVELSGKVTVQYQPNQTGRFIVVIARDGAPIYSTVIDVTTAYTALSFDVISFHWEDVNIPTGYHSYDLYVLSTNGSLAKILDQFSIDGTCFETGL